MKGTAFRLGWQDGDRFQMSEFGFFGPEAAAIAAPNINRIRAARGREMYSHVIAFDGERLLDVKPLEDVAA